MRESAYDELFKAEDKHWWYLGLHDLILLFCKQLFPDRSLRVLDAGCGTGGLLSLMLNHGHEVAGLDFSDYALAYCRERGLENLRQADLNDWSSEPLYYDLIVCMDVLYHAWIQSEVRILRALASGLKNGGVLMLNLPALPILSRPHDRVVMGERRYTKKMLRNILAEADLLPILLSYRLPHAFIPLLVKRLFQKDESHELFQSDVSHISAMNGFLYRINKLENRMIKRGVSFAFGSSLFTVAVRM
mgnify:CR=1 FL=1